MRKLPPESAEYPHGKPSGSGSTSYVDELEDNSHKVELQQQEEDNEESAGEHIKPAIQLADFVGDHGAYQLSLSALLFLRYVLLGLMANSGPLMTPDVTFYCHLPRDEIVSLMPNISLMSASEQELEIKEEFKQICQLDLHLYKNVSLLARNATTKSQAKTTPLIITAGQPLQAMTSTTGSGLAAAAGATSATGSNESRIRECTDFTYQLNQDQGLTMTSEFDLVCDRDWLRSLFQALISASIVIAHVFWGTFSDKFGRFQAQRICLVVSLTAGLLAIFAPDFWTFTLARALCSFGDLGMVVSMTTTVVELVGSKYRGLSVAAVNFGYALGVSLLPYVVAYFENFRLVVAFTVLCHMLSMPFILATGESIRWLLSNRKFKQARRELKRIARWNRLWTSEGKIKFESDFKEFISQLEAQQFDQLEVTLTVPQEPEVVAQPRADLQGSAQPEVKQQLTEQLTQAQLVCQSWRRELLPSSSLSVPVVEQTLSSSRNSSICDEDELRVTRTRVKQQPDCINLVAHQLSFVGRVSRLFKDKQLMIAVFTIVWTTFNSELLYTSFIIINLEVGEDVYLNYILGGCMEALAAIMASLLLSYAPRRLSLIAFWLLISMSCFGLSLAHIDSTWAVWMLALAKFSQSSLSSIASVAAYEAFPTFLRQSGSGLVFTLGMLGSVFAPLIFAEFDDHAGMDNVLLTFSFSSLTAATLIYLFLTETRNCELM